MSRKTPPRSIVIRAPAQRVRATRRSHYVNNRAAPDIDWLDSGAPYGVGEQPGGWGNSTPNANLGGFSKLVRRMRDLESFAPAMKGAQDIWADEVLAKSGVLIDYEKWPALQEVFNWWVPECDFDEAHPLDLVGKEEQVVRMTRRDGQVIIRHIHQTDLSRVPLSRVPYQFQLLQIDHLPSWYNMPLPNGGWIHGGRQFDRNGRLEGFWMFPVHPHDFQIQYRTEKYPVPIFVNGAEITVVRDIGEPSSARTTPPMRPAATPLRENHEFMDSEQVRMRNNSNQGFMISAPGYSDDEEREEEIFGGSGGPGNAPGPNSKVPFDVDPMEPGGGVVIPPGWKIEQTKPGEVGVSFGEFVKRTWTAAAIGTGTPYGRFADDYGSYSSDRIAKIADRDFSVRVARWRDNVLVKQFLRAVGRRFAIAAYISGQWKPEAGTDMREVYLAGPLVPRRDRLHELQGEQAAELAIKTGLESRDDLAAKRGKKGAQIDFENAVSQERKRLLGQVVVNSKGEMVPYPPPPDTPMGRRITEFAQRSLDREAFAFEGSTRVTSEVDPGKQVAAEPELTDTFDTGGSTGADGYYVFGTLGTVTPAV